MANGILGAQNLQAGIVQAIYTCNNDQATVLTLNIVNRSGVPTRIRVAISTSSTAPANTEWIEYDTGILPKGVLERTGIIVSPGMYLLVVSDIAPVNAVCWGIEVGTAVYSNNIVTNSGATPTWVTAAGSLGTITNAQTTNAVSLVATDPYAPSVKFSLASGSLPSGTSLESNGTILARTDDITGYSSGGTTTSFDVRASNGTNSAVRSFSITRQWADGSSQSKAAPSAQYIKNLTGTNSDGAYWIATGGSSGLGQQIYCVMNSAMSGGGWMMAMKATRGTTFQYSSQHWTDASTTINTGDVSRGDSDAKYATFNYFLAKDVMALWPDLGNGGDISGQGYGTVWIENDFYRGTRINLPSFFNTVSNYRPSSLRIRSSQWNGGSQFSSQSGNQFYGWNFTQNSNSKVRWGFAWNNETEWLSNDVTGGIGTQMNGGYSAGDYIGCCADISGFNRTARVEMYVR